MNVNKIRYMTSIGITTAILCVLAPIAIPIPFSPVPISMATFIIYLFAIVFGCKKIMISTLLYIFIGCIGIPVFSKYSAGFGVVLSPTGGYLIGYLGCAFFSGLFSDRVSDIKSTKSKIFVFIGMIMGTIVLYTFGTIWLVYSSVKVDSFFEALGIGVIPFIPGDIIKMIICIIIAPYLKSRVQF